jgi:hypothetical protein
MIKNGAFLRADGTCKMNELMPVVCILYGNCSECFMCENLIMNTIKEIDKMRELTCEQCNNYTGTKDIFSSECEITGETINDSGMVCNCDSFSKFEEVVEFSPDLNDEKVLARFNDVIDNLY